MLIVKLAARMAALPCQAILAVDDWLNPSPQRPERPPMASIRWPDECGQRHRRVPGEDQSRPMQARRQRRA